MSSPVRKREMRAVRKTGAPLEDGTATAMPMDRAKLEAFAQKAIADVGSTLTTLMCSLGDRLGLFKASAMRSPRQHATIY